MADDSALVTLLWVSDHEDNGASDDFVCDALAFLDAPACPVAVAPAITTDTVARCRNEIAQLRRDVASLEELCSSLRKRRRIVSPTDAVLKWEAMATRERARRELSTRKNEQLKRAVEELQQQHDALETQLRRAKRKIQSECEQESLDPRSHVPRGSSMPSARVEELTRSLQQQYLDTDAVLIAARADSTYHPLRSSLQSRVTLRKTLEVAQHVIYPFDYQDTVSEVWHTFSGLNDAQLGVNFHSVEMGEDSFRLELAINAQFQRKRADFQLATVAKRIVESRRTVIEWAGLAVPSELGTTNMDGVSVCQRGWSIVEPVDASVLSSGATKAATRSTMFFEDNILVEEEVEKKGRKTSLLLQYLSGIYAREGDTRRQLTENRLFDKALSTASK